MIGVIIPAHDEEALIGACLRSVLVAAESPELRGERVEIVVALDRCSDGTAAIVAAHGVRSVALQHGNVGHARAAAANVALDLGARWIATTDADTIVPPDWLSAQLAYDCDAFCGVVTVDDWSDYPAAMLDAFAGTEAIVDGHPHVHGANMGLSAAAYRLCGGFDALDVSEDVALVGALVAAGARIARKPSPVVVTSARRAARAVGGFSDYLRALEARLIS